MKILITGSCGFIGFHLCNELLKNTKNKLVGIDNLSSYYDVTLKKNRLNILKKKKNFIFYKIDICNEKKLETIFKKYKFEYVIHLAAQAGVRHSIKFPRQYLNANISGFFNVIDLSAKNNIKHFIYASTSSVYGDSKKFPLIENTNTDKPMNFYAATKKSNEVISYSYSNIFKLPTTGLRFFTVYGPYGRPDMALFKFVSGIKNNKKIYLFNNGKHLRDFTYIDDVVYSIKKLILKIPKNKVPYRILNIGSNNPIKLKNFLQIIENYIGKKANYEYLSLQQGDINKTHSSNTKLKKLTKFVPATPINIGVKKFLDWYNKYFK